MSTETIVNVDELVSFFFGRGNETDYAEILGLAGTESAPGLKALDDRVQIVEALATALGIDGSYRSVRVDNIEFYLVGIAEALGDLETQQASRGYDILNYVTGNIVPTESTFTVAATRALQLNSVRTGDLLEFSVSGSWSNEAETGYLDFLNDVSLRYVSLGTTTAATSGVKAWEGKASVLSAISGSWRYVVRSDDHVLGFARWNLVWKTAAAGDKTLLIGANDPLQLSVINLSHG